MYKTFLEYASEREAFDDFKRAVLNAIDATEDALSEPLAAFKKAKDLANPDRNPNVAELINSAPNKAAVVSAIENARNTKISIADLLALYRAGSDRKRVSPKPDKKPKPIANDQPNPQMPAKQPPQQQKPNAGSGIPGLGR